MRICIFGAGAMGTSLGALLTRSGTECELVSRSREHVAALNERGAILNGGAPVPVKACLPEEMAGQYDIIFLAAKQRDNAKIAAFLEPFLKEDGALVTVQNGLPERALADVIGKDRVYGCALTWGAERTGAGRIEVTSESGFPMALGAYGKGERLEEIAAILKKAGNVTVGNLSEIRFAKLALNASLSTLSAISGLTFGELSKGHKKHVLALIHEVFAVARAYGSKKLPQGGHDLFKVFGAFGRITLPVAVKKYRGARSGMLLDLEAGRRCEVDYVAGACVKAGEEKGIPCPNLSRAVELVHEIENGLAEIAPESLGLLDL